MLPIIIKSIATTLLGLLMFFVTISMSKNDKKSYQVTVFFDFVMTLSIVAMWF